MALVRFFFPDLPSGPVAVFVQSGKGTPQPQTKPESFLLTGILLLAARQGRKSPDAQHRASVYFSVYDNVEMEGSLN